MKYKGTAFTEKVWFLPKQQWVILGVYSTHTHIRTPIAVLKIVPFPLLHSIIYHTTCHLTKNCSIIKW